MTATVSPAAVQTWTPPSPGELLATAATKSSATVADIETVLREVGITLPSPIPPHRRVKVLRLRVDGVKKTGEQINIDQRLDAGVWAIMHPSNSAGKTSLLEFLVWALRGRPRDLPNHVKAWVRRIAVDVTVSGQHVRVVINQDVSSGRPHVTAVLLSAGTEGQLLSAADGELRMLVSADGEEPVEQLIGAFMRESLGLDSTELWNRSGGLDGEGAAQVHGWPAYFGAFYLNPGGDKLLLGDVPGPLPAKLLELFIDLTKRRASGIGRHGHARPTRATLPSAPTLPISSPLRPASAIPSRSACEGPEEDSQPIRPTPAGPLRRIRVSQAVGRCDRSAVPPHTRRYCPPDSHQACCGGNPSAIAWGNGTL
ncbi:hypothetical protein OOK41_03530 [Micromonospora sp. NBC_01655]|uniref:hypothetical protein n=1 Tax=Micromonospora sp. NBC_01655 TaxID=2975983 RepID=UPI002257B5EC|nr:hypothetical protein [Micromonospora sp. NBC_01655]MCX4469390.1 hypothetical protein [Micromonospora sp. NBC_01655]